MTHKRKAQWRINWIWQWSGVFNYRTYNWVDFDFIKTGFEYAAYAGGRFEFWFVILGIGVFVARDADHPDDCECSICRCLYIKDEVEAGNVRFVGADGKDLEREAAKEKPNA